MEMQEDFLTGIPQITQILRQGRLMTLLED
jgi:hypothetical protein